MYCMYMIHCTHNVLTIYCVEIERSPELRDSRVKIVRNGIERREGGKEGRGEGVQRMMKMLGIEKGRGKNLT